MAVGSHAITFAIARHDNLWSQHICSCELKTPDYSGLSHLIINLSPRRMTPSWLDRLCTTPHNCFDKCRLTTAVTQHSLVQLYKLFTLHGWLCTLRDSQFKYSAIKVSLKCCPCDGLQHETQAWVNMRDRRKINRWNLLCTVIIQSVGEIFFKRVQRK